MQHQKNQEKSFFSDFVLNIILEKFREASEVHAVPDPYGLLLVNKTNR